MELFLVSYKQSMFTKKTLKNGVRMVLVPYQDTKAATLLVLFRVGSRYETDPLNGASHFLEHLYFKGTHKRPTTLDISRELDAVGAEYNAFTGKDHTGYYIKITSEHLPLAADILEDMLLHSKFEAKELDRERTVVTEEIHMYEDNPIMFVDELLEGEVFRGSTLGWRISGSREHIAKMDRDAMLRYRKDYYVPRETVVAVAGRYTDATVKQIEKYFSKPFPWQSNERKQFKKFSLASAGYTAPRIKVHFKDTNQVQCAIGFPSYAMNHPQHDALSILSVILGGTMSSRLFVEVREKKGLAYMVRSSAQPFEDTGIFTIQAGLDKSRINEAITTILAEVKKIVDKGVTAQELKDAKENVRGRFVLNLEESNELANFVGKQELFLKKIYTPEERLKRFSAVTREQVHATARDIFKTPRMSMALIGPYKDAEPFQKLLHL